MERDAAPAEPLLPYEHRHRHREPAGRPAPCRLHRNTTRQTGHITTDLYLYRDRSPSPAPPAVKIER